jgi:hypothetical protein
MAGDFTGQREMLGDTLVISRLTARKRHGSAVAALRLDASRRSLAFYAAITGIAGRKA